MGFWSRVFGGGDRRPDGERAGEMRDGKKYGVWIELHHEFLCERTYVAGVIHGPVREWHRDGHLFEKVAYAAGKRDGVMHRFHPGGVLAVEATYIGGRLHGVVRAYDQSGSLRYEQEYRDDQLWNGHFDPETPDRNRYVDGKKVGLWEKLTYDKKIEERGIYVDGKRHGEFELRDRNADVWTGSFDMDERVGVWELRRPRSGVIATGEYPRGMRVPWTATHGEKRMTFEITNRDDLDRWIKLVEQWLGGLIVHDFTGWSAAERGRANEWIEGQLAEHPITDEVDDGAPFEADARASLVHASGDISSLALPAIDVDEDRDYMEWWYPPRAGTIEVIATNELPDRMIVDSPELPDARRVFRFRPGAYEVVGLDDGHRASLPFAIVRMPGATIARWRFLGTAHDDSYAMLPIDLDRETFAWPGPPEGANGPREWIQLAAGPTVLVTNPSGNGIRTHAALDESGAIIAVFLQLF